MRLIIAFVTAAPSVLETVADRQLALLPHDVRANGFASLGGAEPVLAAFNTNLSKSLDEFLNWLDWENATGVMLLTDGSLPELMTSLGDQFNIHRFNPPAYGAKMANHLTAMIAKCLRPFRYLATRFSDAKYRNILRIPLRNFDAPEIEKLRQLCRDMAQRNYGKEIDCLLRDMRKRQLPKRASDYPELYYVDEGGKHFKLGHEHHAQADTAIPPHNALCIVANQFRFGQWFDGRTHYNVSRDKKVSMEGIYSDCHGADKIHQTQSHINMFTNDFF